MIAGMTDTADHDGTGPTTEEAAAPTPRERRIAAWRNAPRVLARLGFLAPLKERLALLEAAGEAYDLDETADIYGNGVVEALERRVADLLGTEAAAFFPTGTMAQQVALRCWAGRTGNPAVALHPLSHPEVYERNAFSQVSGLRPVHFANEPRLPTAEEVRDLPEPFGALMLELPLRDAGFVLPTWDELTEVTEAARERRGRPLRRGAAVGVHRALREVPGGDRGPRGQRLRVLLQVPRRLRRRRPGRARLPDRGGEDLAAPVRRRGVPAVPDRPVRADRARPGAAPPAGVRAPRARGGRRPARGPGGRGLPFFRVHPEVPHTYDFQVWLPYETEVVAETAIRAGEETGRMLFANHWDPKGPGLTFTEVYVRAAALEWTADDVREAAADFARRLTGA